MTFTGDRRAGCMCAYIVTQPHVLRNKKAEQAGSVTPNTDRLHADVFVTGTGVRTNRYLCHRAFTKAFPTRIDSPDNCTPQGCRALLGRVFSSLRDALHSFLRFIFPKIQFGMGINLFRVN